jgi:DMSO/TMAO reductase YedYZ molybdopterin-dependent catalytic subunit
VPPPKGPRGRILTPVGAREGSAGTPDGGRTLRRGWVAGLAAAGVATFLLALTSAVVPDVPFLPLSIAQSLVRATPGGVATYFIELLGHWALRLAIVGTAIAFLAAGAILGLLIPLYRDRLGLRASVAGVASLLPLWAVSVALYPSEPGNIGRVGFSAVLLGIVLVAGLAAGWVFLRLMATPPVGDGREADPTRRYFMRSLGLGGLGLIIGVSDLGRVLHRRPNPGNRPLRISKLTRAARPSPAPADASFSSIPGLTPDVTSNRDFYVVDEEIVDPDIDPETWRLDVSGLVDRPVQLSYAELLALPAVERYQTLECISNEVGGHLMSTAKWAGVPLPLILDRAGVRSAAVEVVFRAGGYSDSLSIDQAMDESTLIVVGMNGHVLPREHGFPARVLSVGTYGMKNPKWLTSIEVVDRPYQGYWEQRGWSKAAVVKTGARIDVPRAGARVDGPVTIAGVAFAGDRGISAVEVSTNGGRAWRRAELQTALSPYTWRLWRSRWTFEDPGGAGLLVRAYDGRGVPQISRHADPHPSGASGYHAVSVTRETT